MKLVGLVNVTNWRVHNIVSSLVELAGPVLAVSSHE